MRRRGGRRPPAGFDSRLPLELQAPPLLTADVFDAGLAEWRRWAQARREWREVADPERAGPAFREDSSLPWRLAFERWGGMPPLLGGQAAADEQAARWARTRSDRGGAR